MGWIRRIYRMHRFWHRSGELLHCMAVAGLVCSVDQMLKSAIDTEPKENFPREMPGSRGCIRIMRAHNPGFSRGRLAKYPELVKLSSIAAVGFLSGGLHFLTACFPKRYRLRKLGMAVVIGGALSNVLDRIMNGAVTDYLNIRISRLKELIVNLGDIAIVFGGGLYFLSCLLERDR